MVCSGTGLEVDVFPRIGILLFDWSWIGLRVTINWQMGDELASYI